jgi:hypothetical protein
MGANSTSFKWPQQYKKNSMEISKQVQGRSSWNSLIKKGSDVKDDIPSIITIIMANITMLASS